MTYKSSRSSRDALWHIFRPDPNWGPADKNLKLQRYTDPEFSQHWSWLPNFIRIKENIIRDEFQKELSHMPMPRVNEGFQPVDDP